MQYLDLINEGIISCVDKTLEIGPLLNDKYKNNYNKLTKEEKEYIYNYTEGYRSHNDITFLNPIIKRFKAPFDLTIYRGTCMSKFKNTCKLERDRFKTSTIWSLSINPLIAKNFSYNNRVLSGLESYVIMELDIPKGYPFLWIEPLSALPGESEGLISSNSQFEIIEKKTSYDKEIGENYKIYRIKPII